MTGADARARATEPRALPPARSHGGSGWSSALLALALAACSALPTEPSPLAGEALSGRLAVRVDGHEGVAPRQETAAFELRGDAGDGQLDLATPLGSVIARARWSAAAVELATPQGRSRYPDLDALTRAVLGESVPVAALFDWLHGRPWPGAPSTPAVDPAAAGFEQLGWTVDLARLAEGRIAARRAGPPVVTVQARLDLP